MGWTAEQIAAMATLGIDPAHIPAPGDRRSERRIVEVNANSELTDAEYQVLQSLLPPEPRQAGAILNRGVLNGLLWVQLTNNRLTHLPPCYGTPEAVRKRAERWAVIGIWNRLLEHLDVLNLTASRRESIRRLAVAHARRGASIRQSRASMKL